MLPCIALCCIVLRCALLRYAAQRRFFLFCTSLQFPAHRCTIQYSNILLPAEFFSTTRYHCNSSHLASTFLLLCFSSTIFQASNMKTSNGSLELCYDELNRPYKIPLFCFTNPENILDPKSPVVKINSPQNIFKSCSQSTFCVQPLNLRIRINPGDVNLKILLSTADTISDLKHAILEQSSIQVPYRNILYVQLFLHYIHTVLYYFVMFLVVLLHCFDLYCTVLHCFVPNHTVSYCIFCTALYCILLPIIFS